MKCLAVCGVVEKTDPGVIAKSQSNHPIGGGLRLRFAVSHHPIGYQFNPLIAKSQSTANFHQLCGPG